MTNPDTIVGTWVRLPSGRAGQVWSLQKSHLLAKRLRPGPDLVVVATGDRWLTFTTDDFARLPRIEAPDAIPDDQPTLEGT